LFEKDILKDHRIVTYREKEHDTLMAIRNGFYMNPDGTYKKEFFRLVDDKQKEITELYEKTTLPESPDTERVRRIVMDIKESIMEKRPGA
jgi:hypothetical protein